MFIIKSNTLYVTKLPKRHVDSYSIFKTDFIFSVYTSVLKPLHHKYTCYTLIR